MEDILEVYQRSYDPQRPLVCRNRKHAKVNWQFTTADARVKLKRLYLAL